MLERTNYGDSRQITREYFDSLLIEMRHIDAEQPSLEFEFFGHTFQSPIMTAALSELNTVHTDGIVELARGAAAADAVFWTGACDERELSRIVSSGAKAVRIIKPNSSDDIIHKEIEQAEKLGAIAVGMDIDSVFDDGGNPRNIMGYKMCPKSQTDIIYYARSTTLPFIVKGVLSVQDAVKCLESEVSGIVISHHNGIMDYAVPPLMVLPEIIETVDGQIPVFVDCGILSGYDAFKALALGASGVCVGSALIRELEAGGAAGVRTALERMNRELSGVMARTCTPDLHSFDPDLIWER